MTDFEQMYRDHFNSVHNVVKRIVKDEEIALDITQEVFVRAWNNLDSFRGESEPRTWLTRIAINRASDHLRKNKEKNQTLPLKEINGEYVFPSRYTDVASPERILMAADREEQMLQALDNLDEKYKLPFMLRQFSDMSYKDIADQLEIPVNTARVRTHRAREAVKKGCGESNS